MTVSCQKCFVRSWCVWLAVTVEAAVRKYAMLSLKYHCVLFCCAICDGQRCSAANRACLTSGCHSPMRLALLFFYICLAPTLACVWIRICILSKLIVFKCGARAALAASPNRNFLNADHPAHLAQPHGDRLCAASCGSLVVHQHLACIFCYDLNCLSVCVLPSAL